MKIFVFLWILILVIVVIYAMGFQEEHTIIYGMYTFCCEVKDW